MCSIVTKSGLAEHNIIDKYNIIYIIIYIYGYGGWQVKIVTMLLFTAEYSTLNASLLSSVYYDIIANYRNKALGTIIQ